MQVRMCDKIQNPECAFAYKAASELGLGYSTDNVVTGITLVVERSPQYSDISAYFDIKLE